MIEPQVDEVEAYTVSSSGATSTNLYRATWICRPTIAAPSTSADLEAN
jgi:hypothetical protein